MAVIMPKIGAKGIFKLIAPYDQLLVPNTHYSCVAIRGLSDIIGAGGDGYLDYYEKYSITKEQFQTDLNNNVCIITLQDGNGNLVYVPHLYIDGFPEVNGYVYNNIVLAIDIGQIPEYLNLSVIKDKITDVVLENFGINASVKVIVTSNPTIVMNDDHAAIEAARQANIAVQITDHARVLELTAERDLAYSKIQELETYIFNNPVA